MNSDRQNNHSNNKTTIKYLTQGNRVFERFHLIEQVVSLPGLCSLMTAAINGIRIALNENSFPIINFHKEVAYPYYEASYGENVWEYYFEPVMGIGTEKLQMLIESGEIPQETIKCDQLTIGHEVIETFGNDPDHIATFWSDKYERPNDPQAWFTSMRARGRKYVQKYIRPLPHIIKQVDDFYQQNLSKNFVIGVHIRGTDFDYASATSPDNYFREIRKYIEEKNIDPLIFLATDQQQFVDLFRKEFGNKIITTNAQRSQTRIPTFLDETKGGYHKGEEVLIDILLLAKCDYLFKCASAPGEYAMWFAPQLTCTDFALESDRLSQTAPPAFLSLNVEGNNEKLQGYQIFVYRVRQIVLNLIMAIARCLLPSKIRNWLWQKIGQRIYT